MEHFYINVVTSHQLAKLQHACQDKNLGHHKYIPKTHMPLFHSFQGQYIIPMDKCQLVVLNVMSKSIYHVDVNLYHSMTSYALS